MNRFYLITLLALILVLPGRLSAQLPCTVSSAVPGDRVSDVLWNPATVPVLAPPYTVNYPPIALGGGYACTVCPALFSTPICAGKYAQIYVCAGNIYTISMCSSPTTWNSTLSIIDQANLWNPPGGFFTSDNDGCGVANGHAQLTYVPNTNQLIYIRVFKRTGAGSDCNVDALSCGTLTISCAPQPPPPTNDNPCNAEPPLTVDLVCNNTPTGTTWATSTLGIPAPGCGTYIGGDVWYSTVVPASGALAVQTTHSGASNLAMAVYQTPTCSGLSGSITATSTTMTVTSTVGMVTGMAVTGTGIAGGTTIAAIVDATTITLSVAATLTTSGTFNFWKLVTCNADLVTGSVLNPYIAFNLPALAGQTVWIRVWPQGSASVGGSFEICAVEPIPPVNDNPCGATTVPVTPACTPISSSTQSATTTVGPPAPGCGALSNDVWFTVTVPSSPPLTGVIINTTSTALNDASMAIYAATPNGDCAGTLALITCLSPAGATLPSITVNQNGTTVVGGTVLFVRVWNNNAAFGNFTICATPTQPPANDEPCGAIAVPLNYGCLFTPFTNANASQTPLSFSGQHSSVPNPVAPCASAAPASDVWFTVQVPNPVPLPSLLFDTDDGTMTDAAMTVYRVASGTCGAGNLALTQIACATSTSPNGVNMPALSIPAGGLVAGETLYIRIWRQNANNGTFQLCARRPDAAPGDCNFTLRMSDLGGDGWNGSYVTITVGGVPTNYTIGSANGNITFGANIGQLVIISYTAVGGFQNQISYQLTTPGGGVIFSSGTTPATGVVLPFTVDGSCNVPPAPQEDCVGAFRICQASSALSANPQNTGAVQDLTTANRGCLITNERLGLWYSFRITTSGQLGFTVNSFPYGGGSDYDYGVWGPYPSVSCPPVGLPTRCSWADGVSLTGLNYIAADLSEGVFGDSWTRYLDVTAGDWYILFLDNWYLTGNGFDLTFQLQGGASIQCLLPVELLTFGGKPVGSSVHLKWSTGSERMSDHFIVERSIDGVSFADIGRVEAAGNSTTQVDYNFIDHTPAKGANYYRLRQVDEDGRTETSHTVSVMFLVPTTTLQVMPNPASESIQALFDLPMDEAFTWRITDASGRLVKEGNSVSVDGPDRLDIALGGIESGAYALSLTGRSEGFIGQTRFLKQ